MRVLPLFRRSLDTLFYEYPEQWYLEFVKARDLGHRTEHRDVRNRNQFGWVDCDTQTWHVIPADRFSVLVERLFIPPHVLALQHADRRRKLFNGAPEYPTRLELLMGTE